MKIKAAKIKAVLFDKDGTLLDFELTYGRTSARIIQELSHGDKKLESELSNAVAFDLRTLQFQSHSVLISGTMYDIAKAWQPILGISDVGEFAIKLDQMAEMETQNSVVPFDYTHLSLRKLLGAGYPLGIATNDTEKNARDHMAAISAKSLFSFFAGYDSGFGEKPGPGMVNAFAKFHDISTENVAMVGDSPADMQAAKSAGAMAIAVASGPHGAGELEKYSEKLIENISHLPDLLDSLK